MITLMDFGSNVTNYYCDKYLIDKRQETVIRPDLEKALEFYQTHVLDCNARLEPVLRTYQFPSRLPFWKWELFSAILMGDVAGNYSRQGADLTKHEVKSRLNKECFEYQYHKNSWREKLAKEPLIKHVYISYWDNFKNLDVRVVDGYQLINHFEKWEPELVEAYECDKPKQRFRRRIPFKEVVEKGTQLLKIRGGRIMTKHLIP
jgi:hypothetical protein